METESQNKETVKMVMNKIKITRREALKRIATRSVAIAVTITFPTELIFASEEKRMDIQGYTSFARYNSTANESIPYHSYNSYKSYSSYQSYYNYMKYYSYNGGYFNYYSSYASYRQTVPGYRNYINYTAW